VTAVNASHTKPAHLVRIGARLLTPNTQAVLQQILSKGLVAGGRQLAHIPSSTLLAVSTDKLKMLIRPQCSLTRKPELQAATCTHDTQTWVRDKSQVCTSGIVPQWLIQARTAYACNCCRQAVLHSSLVCMQDLVICSSTTVKLRHYIASCGPRQSSYSSLNCLLLWMAWLLLLWMAWLLLLCISLTINANDSHRPESCYGCHSGQAINKAPRLIYCAEAAAALCTSSEWSRKQWPAATCNKAQIHKSNLLQQVSVYHTVCHSAQATFTAMVPAMQQQVFSKAAKKKKM